VTLELHRDEFLQKFLNAIGRKYVVLDLKETAEAQKKTEAKGAVE
jgi:hypothetical protein